VLGAWKFQQGKFCNCDKSGLGFLGGFFVSVSAKEGFFSSQERHTCEEERSNSRTCERRVQSARVREIGQAARVRKIQ
jgi:hypothetical protein